MVEIKEIDPAQEFEAKFYLRHKALNEATQRGDSSVQQFYRGASVFITGGSGFLGKQFIEKLFRATQVFKVFVLLRPKKGKPIEQRLNEMLQDPVYDMLREQQPDFAERIVPVAGDAAELRLGLSDEDWNMVTEEVNLIYHMAATTRFDETLRVATMINVRGAREALVLGKACKKLVSYVHVSTAYSYASEDMKGTQISEEFYRSPLDPETLIGLAEDVDEKRLNDITSRLIKNWPNTYSFAKAVSEDLVKTLGADLPLCVVRPAIVTCAFKEPNPGWLDISNVYGASGIIVGAGLGVMHTALIDTKICLDLVPVDYVNNAIITAAWETASRPGPGDKTPKIYNVAATRNLVPWGHLKDVMSSIRFKFPSARSVGYNFTFTTNNSILFWIYTWLLHLIPGYIIDGICLLLGKERRFVKLYRKMHKISIVLSYFALNEWRFDDSNTATLYQNLSSIDKEIFEFDFCKIDWKQYLILWCLGVRKYILKDELKGTAYAIKKQYVLRIVVLIFAPIYLYFLYKVSSLAITILLLPFTMCL